MNRRKKAILLALSLFVAAVFAACGGSSKDGSSQAKTEGPVEAVDQTDASDQADVSGQADISDQTDASGQADMSDQTDASGQVDASDQADASDQVDADAADQVRTGADQAADVERQPVADQFHIELQEVGRVSCNDKYSIDDGALLYYEGDEAKFCDFKGNIVDDRPIAGAEYLGWDLYCVDLKNDEDINSVGLVTTDGEVLIPFDAAIITFTAKHKEREAGPRYILAFTGTGQTTNQDEALFTASDSPFTDDDDTLYKGFIRIFDLKTRQYVNGLKFDHGNSEDFDQVGDNILVDIDDKAVVYSPDGKVVYTEQGYLQINSKYMIDRHAGQSVIMDAQGNQLYSTDISTSVLHYDSDYFTQRENNMTTVINAKGEPVLNGEWSLIIAVSQDRFCTKKEGDTDYTLLAADNTVIDISPNVYAYNALGFLMTTKSDYKNMTVITPGNRIFEGLDIYPLNMVFTKDDRTSYLVLNTGEFVSGGGNFFRCVSDGLISLNHTEKGETKSGLIDAFTGETLVDFVYDKISPVDLSINDYIYCTDNENIVIYRVNIVAKE